MMPLAIIGILIVASIIGFGVWKMMGSVTFRKTTDRYRYVRAKDENGNDIVKVIDAEDRE